MKVDAPARPLAPRVSRQAALNDGQDAGLAPGRLDLAVVTGELCGEDQKFVAAPRCLAAAAPPPTANMMCGTCAGPMSGFRQIMHLPNRYLHAE